MAAVVKSFAISGVDGYSVALKYKTVANVSLKYLLEEDEENFAMLSLISII
jgi:hypothetical protein